MCLTVASVCVFFPRQASQRTPMLLLPQPMKIPCTHLAACLCAPMSTSRDFRVARHQLHQADPPMLGLGMCAMLAGTYPLTEAPGLHHRPRPCPALADGSLWWRLAVSVVAKYGCLEPGMGTPITEDTKPLPDQQLNGTYARTKAAAERLVVAANGDQLRTVVLRPGGIYGVNDPVSGARCVTAGAASARGCAWVVRHEDGLCRRGQRERLCGGGGPHVMRASPPRQGEGGGEGNSAGTVPEPGASTATAGLPGPRRPAVWPARRPGSLFEVGPISAPLPASPTPSPAQTIISSSIARSSPFIGPGHNQVPFVWVDDCARAHVMAVERLLMPEDFPGPSIAGRVFHLCHDPVEVRQGLVQYFAGGGTTGAGGGLSPAPSNRPL